MGLSNADLQSRIKELEEKIKILEKNKPKKFGLVWEEKTEDVVEECKENIPILKLKNKTKGIEPILILDKDKPENILIEGDNYEALNVLNYTHKGKIDVIYIDPPYNTENKDFRYNDDYIDSEDVYRHSKWLSFMNQRLILSRNLLKESGVIFISIDEIEYARLKILCDQIFGENNLVSAITVKTSSVNGFKIYGNKPVRVKDYILVYSKSFKDYVYNRIYLKKNGFWDSHYNFYYDYEKNKLFSLKDILIENKIIGKDTKLNEILLDNEIFKEFYIKHKNNICQTAGYPEGEYKNKSIENKDNVCVFKNKSGERVYLYNGRMLSFLSSSFNKIEDTEYEDVSLALSDIWDDIDYNNIQNETHITLNNGQKPLRLIERIIKTVTNHKDILILDFFAGSGTTGHAVLELNKDDGGNRKFILCTNNENKIAEEVTYERIKRVMKGYKNKKGEEVKGLGGNLKYFKTAFVDKDKLEGVNDDTKLKLTYEVGEMIGLKEGTLNEIEKNEYWQIFDNLKGEKITAIYFKENKEKLKDLVEKLEEEIKKRNKKNTDKTEEKQNKYGEKIDGVKVALYVFSWTKNKYRNEYGSEDIRVEDIPEPILEVYKEINKI